MLFCDTSALTPGLVLHIMPGPSLLVTRALLGRFAVAIAGRVPRAAKSVLRVKRIELSGMRDGQSEKGTRSIKEPRMKRPMR